MTGCIAFALVFGTSLSDAVIVGGCLALSSTPVAVGGLTKEEHRQPHGELLLGFATLLLRVCVWSSLCSLKRYLVWYDRVLIVQDGIFGVFLAALSAMGDGTGVHGPPRRSSGDGGSGPVLFCALGLVVVGVACWFIRRRLHHMHNLCCRHNRVTARCLHQLGVCNCGSWLYERVARATSATDEAVLLGALCAMATGRTVTEELGERKTSSVVSVCASESMTSCYATGMSGEIGCLLMGLSVVPILSTLSRLGATREQLSVDREPSPRQRLRVAHHSSPSPRQQHNRFPLSVDVEEDALEHQRLLDHDDVSEDESKTVSPGNHTGTGRLVSELHGEEASTLHIAQTTPESACLKLAS